MIRRFAGGRVFTDYHDEAWHTSLFRVALIAVMAGSFAAGPLVFRWGLGGAWSGYLLPAAALAGAAGALTTGLLGRPSWRDRRGGMFRLGEMLLVLIFARLLAWVFAEGLPALADIRGWLPAPGGFFSGEFAFASLTLLLSWGLGAASAGDFRDLAIQPDEVAARESRDWGDSKSQWRAGQPRPRMEILQGFAVRWVLFGALLVICAGLTKVSVSTTEQGLVKVGLRGLGMRGDVIAALVCYFLSGLLLMSHGRLAVLRARWYNQEVDLGPSVMQRWHTTSFAFIIVIALLALLLPLGTTGWLADALQWLIALVARIMMAIVFVFSLLIGLLAKLLSSLLGQTQQPAEVPPPPAPEPVPTQAEMVDLMPPWVGGAVLWTIVGVVVVFLLINFARSSGLLEGKLGAQLLRLRLWWRARQARLAQAVSAQVKRMRAPFRRARRALAAQPAIAQRRADPKLPREQVRRYYMRALEEAAQEGVARRAHQTPTEFAGELAKEWPEADTDVGELTDAFLDARYSTREIDEGDATAARTVWQRLARAFRQGRPGSGESR